MVAKFSNWGTILNSETGASSCSSSNWGGGGAGLSSDFIWCSLICRNWRSNLYCGGVKFEPSAAWPTVVGIVLKLENIGWWRLFLLMLWFTYESSSNLCDTTGGGAATIFGMQILGWMWQLFVAAFFLVVVMSLEHGSASTTSRFKWKCLWLYATACFVEAAVDWWWSDAIIFIGHNVISVFLFILPDKPDEIVEEDGSIGAAEEDTMLSENCFILATFLAVGPKSLTNCAKLSLYPIISSCCCVTYPFKSTRTEERKVSPRYTIQEAVRCDGISYLL